jgi:hypothetical protein
VEVSGCFPHALMGILAQFRAPSSSFYLPLF